MTDEQGRRIPIVDKRVSSRDAQADAHDPVPAEKDASPSDLADGPFGTASTSPAAGDDVESQSPIEQQVQQDFLDDLKRLQADFDNYRKRMMREQTAIAERASAGLVERLLPVLDDFDRAVDHESASSGLKLIRKQLMDVLTAEGLEEIPALGERFDPHLHEAVESHEDPDVDEPTCSAVYRSGYKLKGRVLRPAMVGVARPREAADVEPDSAAAESQS